MSHRPPLTLGTAGHIDHGKTSLVRALTGIDTDRLKEEKERGITIELGFAYLELPGGNLLSIVDVPGHERFVKNMVAGAAGIDLVMLVVAADEGVMPQTREHLDICRLLGVRHGLVALTKADLVDPDFLELAREDVAALCEGTFLEGAPIVPVSAVTGQGLEELVRHLDELAARIPPRGSRGPMRLPVDRVFSVRGFGTVVTGTLISGVVRREDPAVVLPGGRETKVRNIQVHGRDVGRARAGQRVALNLAGLEVRHIYRGCTVAAPGTVEPTRMLDARVELLPSEAKGLPDRARVRLHVGTQEVPVVVALLDREVLRPGESAYVQVRSTEWIVACPGDRFVLRAFSPPRTLGGGVVLDHQPPRHKGRRPEVLRDLAVLEEGDAAERLEVFLRVRGQRGLTPVQAQVALGVPLEEARNLLQATVRRGAAIVTDRKTQWHHDRAVVEGLETQAVGILGRFHAENPLKRGMGTEELRRKLPRHMDERLIACALDRLQGAGRVVMEGGRIRRSDFQPRLRPDDREARGRILAAVERRGYQGPTLAELAEELGESENALRPVMEYLVDEGALARTKEGYYFIPRSLQELEQHVVRVLQEKGEVSVADVKAFTGTTRKYTIPLLEYLDGCKVTTRRGDVRVAGPRARLRGAEPDPRGAQPP